MTNAQAREKLFDLVTEVDTPKTLILFAALVGSIVEARNPEKAATLDGWCNIYSREQFGAVFEYLNDQPEATARVASSFVQRHFLQEGVRA